MGWLFKLFGWRDLGDVLNETKVVRLHGVKFVIRKIDPMMHLEGAKVMQAYFAEYKEKQALLQPKVPEADVLKKTKEHMAAVFLKAVVSPKLVKGNEPGPSVEDLLADWTLATAVYSEIIFFTYGKKKLSRGSSLELAF